MITENPFTLSVYAGSQYFCNRTEETRTMINAIQNQRNITLISPRRLGKSGLIKHVFHHLRNEKSLKLFYVDIMDTDNLKDFVNLLAKEVIGKTDNRTMHMLKKFGTVVKSIRPKISVNPMTGQPEIEISFQDETHPETSLSELFAYLQKQPANIVIAFDEFQQITEYPEKNVEALLRKHIQQLTHTHFIFSGSRKHLLLSMFSDYGKPFYQSSELLKLGKIERETYKRFIINGFIKGKKTIKPEALELIMKYTGVHTFYVQYLCNKLYGLPVKAITADIVTETLLKTLKENEIVYFNYKKLLSSFQFKLLEAIAKQGGVSKPTSKDFIGKHHLGTPSSVKTALDALLKKEMIFQDENLIKVYDIFFSIWLKTRN